MSSKITISQSFIVINLVILSGLLYLCYIMNTDIEGISNMNCCGGIEAGVHYSETDTRPPEYVRHCFKSDNQDGKTVYQWNGFPCTSNEAAECCDGSTIGNNTKGECIATGNGGYCKQEGDDSINFYFKKREEVASAYIDSDSDTELDINNPIDMQDYFYKKSTEDNTRYISPEMKRFMSRRDSNENIVRDTIVSNAASKVELTKTIQEKNMEKLQNDETIYTITFIHILILITTAIIIRRLIVIKIQSYLDVIYIQYLKFSGR